MVLATTTSARGNYKTHVGTLQEVLDEIENSPPSHRIGAIYHNGTNYFATIYVRQ